MSDYQPTPPQQPSPYTGGPVPVQKSPVLSILALVFGILGVLGSVFLVGFGFLPGVAAVVLGFIARRKEPTAKGMWLTGLILGFVAIAVAILWLAFGIGAYLITMNSGYSN